MTTARHNPLPRQPHLQHTGAQRPAVHADLTEFFADLDAAVAEHKPHCDQSGRCCKFDSYGHRLYATTLEAAWLTTTNPPPQTSDPQTLSSQARQTTISLTQFVSHDGCPYQVQGLCTAREHRPMGCRIYFCESEGQGWQEALYESFLTRLRQLHEKHDLPYEYREWRHTLDALR